MALHTRLAARNLVVCGVFGQVFYDSVAATDL